MKDQSARGFTPAAMVALASGNADNFAATMTHGGIEAQEAAGQVMFVNSETLPKSMLGRCTRETLEAMGIVFHKEADDLFVHVTLPTGWKKRATNHSMHSDLLDNKGRVRAGIFYKAAFYDRRAHISLKTRYRVNGYFSCDKDGNRSDPETISSHYATVVMDGETEIHRAGIWAHKDYDESTRLEKTAIEWLSNKYSEHNNPLAYWD